MGSANALAAYRLYAGKVQATSLNVLAYMALVSLDKHPEPSWWEGHEMLAIRCFGYSEPVGEAAMRAVRRAITPLFTEGAITTIRHASGHHGRIITVRYRLWLQHPAPDEKRPKPRSGIGRKTAEHRTKNGRAQDGNRPTKEEEEEEEQEIYGVAVVNGTVEGTSPGELDGQITDEMFAADRALLAKLSPERQAALMAGAVAELGKDADLRHVFRASARLNASPP
jgi:hypothetical protein